VTRSAPAAPSTGEAAASERPNVLWVTLCTVRADHLSVYGYDRPTSPTLERLAARGIVFERAVSPSSWTRPSHASLFTGSYLSKHGVDTERQRIPAAALTFSEVVQRAGYQTVGVSNNYNAGTHVGLDRGFDLFVEVWGPLERSMLLHHWYDAFRERLFGERRNMCSARDTNRILATWFDRQHDPERPFFCFVNYAEGHDPYLPPDDEARAFLPEGVTLEAAQEYCRRAFIRHGKEVSSSVPLTREGLAVMQAMYDAELRYQDRRLGELLDDLERRGLLDNTLIVVVGDHGEHFGEHGLLGHENSLYEPLIHVPLIVCYSPLLPAGERVESLVQTTDIMPTSLALCGLEFPGPASQLQGRVLVTASGQLAPADDGANRAIAEFALTSEHPLRMLRENDWKLIDAAVDPDELYDLVRDPYEKDNLSTVESGRADRMAFDLETWSATSVAMTDEADEIELERDAIRMLKSLGYVGGD
jgi:arylsulfatase A-like enzyme